MNLDGWTLEENMVRTVTGLAMNFPGGGGGGRGGGGGGGGAAPAGGRSPMIELDRLIREAQAYGANANRTMDWNLEPLVPLAKKTQPVFVQAGTQQAIRHGSARAGRSRSRPSPRPGSSSSR